MAGTRPVGLSDRLVFERALDFLVLLSSFSSSYIDF